MMAEMFDNKIVSLGFPLIHIAMRDHLTMSEFAWLDFTAQIAAVDGLIVTWQEKRRFDAVRPFSAIRYVYGDEVVRAWGGPGEGTTRFPANQWQSFLNVADHPEYPSASACACSATAQVMRIFTGTDELNWGVTYKQGSSYIEPGITPKTDITCTFGPGRSSRRSAPRAGYGEEPTSGTQWR